MEFSELGKRQSKTENETDSNLSEDSIDPHQTFRTVNTKGSRQSQTIPRRSWVSPLIGYQNMFGHESVYSFRGIESDGSVEYMLIKNLEIREPDLYFLTCMKEPRGSNRDDAAIVQQHICKWESLIDSLAASNMNLVCSDIKRAGTFALQITIMTTEEHATQKIHTSHLNIVIEDIEKKIGSRAVATMVFLQNSSQLAARVDIGNPGIYLIMVWNRDIGKNYIQWAGQENGATITSDHRLSWFNPTVRSTLTPVLLIKLLAKIKHLTGNVPKNILASRHEDAHIPIRWHLSIRHDAQTSNILIQIILMSMIAEMFQQQMSKSLMSILMMTKAKNMSFVNTQAQEINIPVEQTENPNIASLAGIKEDTIKDQHGLGFDQLIAFKGKIVTDLKEHCEMSNERFGITSDKDRLFIGNDAIAKDLVQMLYALIASNMGLWKAHRVFKYKRFWSPEQDLACLIGYSNLDTELQHEYEEYVMSGGGKDSLNRFDCQTLIDDWVPGIGSEKLQVFSEIKLYRTPTGSIENIYQDDDEMVPMNDILLRLEKLLLTRTGIISRVQKKINEIFDLSTSDIWDGSPLIGYRAELLEFSKFLQKVFDPQNAKAYMLFQCGGTNSGKSFSATCISNLLHRMNGITIGSQLNSGFVRVSKLGVRMLRIVEEYKGNVIDEFHHLEANGMQLRKNNAQIDSRVNLTIINCDKSDYSIDREAQYMINQLDEKGHARKQDILSRAEQVKARAYIMHFEDDSSIWYYLSTVSKDLCSVQGQIISLMQNCNVTIWEHNRPLELISFNLWNKSLAGVEAISFFAGDTFFCQTMVWSHVLLRALTHKFPIDIRTRFATQLGADVEKEIDEILKQKLVPIDTNPTLLLKAARVNLLARKADAEQSIEEQTRLQRDAFAWSQEAAQFQEDEDDRQIQNALDDNRFMED